MWGDFGIISLKDFTAASGNIGGLIELVLTELFTTFCFVKKPIKDVFWLEEMSCWIAVGFQWEMNCGLENQMQQVFWFWRFYFFFFHSCLFFNFLVFKITIVHTLWLSLETFAGYFSFWKMRKREREKKSWIWFFKTMFWNLEQWKSLSRWIWKTTSR